MRIHGRAKLGPAGRLALCQAIESGMSLRGAGLPERLAGDSTSLVAAISRRFCAEATFIGVGV
jgi:hypothetical protein